MELNDADIETLKARRESVMKVLEENEAAKLKAEQEMEAEQARDDERRRRRNRQDMAAGIAAIAVVLVLVAAWLTNLVWTFEQETIGPILLGIVGIPAFPIGMAHGIWLWF